MPVRRLACTALIFAALSALTPSAHAASAGEVAGFSAEVGRSWAALTDPSGAVADRLEPGEGNFNYGTMMLASAQLRAAARTGDQAMGDAAVRQIMGSIGRGVPSDPFYVLGASSILRDGQTGRLPAGHWQQIAGPLADWVSRFPAYRGHSLAHPDKYDNWKLIYSAGTLQIAQSGVIGAGISANPAGLRAEVQRVLNTLMPRHAGPRTMIDGVGVARALSDPPAQPQAYHMFSTYLLERIYQTDPSLFGAAALQVREEAGRYALSLMAPDGQMATQGRSLDQSWTLAAAAAYGARRAAQGGPQAGQFKAMADRAFARLVSTYGRLADGTIPVVPGLRSQFTAALMDPYAAMSVYNGLTLFLLEDAASVWPDHVGAAALPADRSSLLVDDLDGSGMVWGRGGGVWWAVSGRKSAADARYDQGVAAVKVKSAGGWRDVLASRPRQGSTRTGWMLYTRRGRARLELSKVSGSGSSATLTGRWKLPSGTYRSATWKVKASDGKLKVSTDLHAGERLSAAVFSAQPGSLGSARAAARRCVVSSGGRACPANAFFSRPGTVTLTLD